MPRIMIKGGVWRNTEVSTTFIVNNFCLINILFWKMYLT